ncbi:CHAD domain-containing protein [Herbiconiux sp. P15]|uniref:CYTH and CHAD domain-containing protein n=1 Tax=Herbiconiux liukaitaii TaxID=3342799 RepID=UPI0035B7C83A
MAHTTQIEIERKYAVDAGLELPLEALGALAAEARQHEAVQLEAVYYDTADGALARERIALRRREGGHDEGWHVKLPATEGREERQWPLDVGAEPGDAAAGPVEVPAVVRDAVAGHVGEAALTPLARLSTSRRILELVDAAGAVVVEIADDSVTGTDARAGTVRVWREWEAELGPAAPDTPEKRAALLDEVEAVLLDAGASPSPSVSKLAQALGRTGLGAPGTPFDSARSAAGESGASGEPVVEPVGGALGAGIRELVDRIERLDPAVRTDEPDAVHELRVVVRRLKTVLAVHRDRVPEVAAGLGLELQRVARALGEVRDLEVRVAEATTALDEVVALRGVDDPAARRRLVDETVAEHAKALEQLRSVLEEPAWSELRDDLAALIGRRPGERSESGRATGIKTLRRSEEKAERRSARKVERKAARKALQKAAKRAVQRSVSRKDAVQATPRVTSVEVPPSEAALAMESLHRSRKAARRLRYVAEFETTTGVLRAERTADLAEELQDALGDHRDASVFAEFVLLTAARAEAAGESGFTYGVLYQRSLDRALEALDRAAEARHALRRLP